MAITLNGTTGIVTPKLDSPDIELNSVNVVERGSNANGEYVRFADGTQICTRELPVITSSGAYGGLFVGSLTVAFAATFIDRPRVSGADADNTVANGWVNVQGINTTQAVAHLWTNAGTATGVVQLIAVGRWF